VDDGRHAAVREKVLAGLLPKVPCAEVWGGRGTGRRCLGCDALITPPDHEYECHMDDGALFYLCLHCLYAWERVIRDSDRLQEST
jgi:hypothetical protein